MSVFQEVPVLESERITLRAVEKEDLDDLLKVYSDKNALPFFNSDNCDGDIFYYPTREQMAQALDFWDLAYKNGWFARLAVVDKATSNAIGTVELCLRISNDEFDHMGILRVDVRSDYEREEILYDIISLVMAHFSRLLSCNGVITKVPVYAVERIKAIQKSGFSKSHHLLTGKDGCTYRDYWKKSFI